MVVVVLSSFHLLCRYQWPEHRLFHGLDDCVFECLFNNIVGVVEDTVDLFFVVGV